jgi:formylglycine-generating enzyme required for sulfatase activity/serine/threonine protein kinase
MPHPDDLTQDRLAATLPVDDRGRPSIGGVSLMRKLGVGGMGAVYLGRQERLGREVAVKILPHNLVEQDPRMVQRFQAEARMAAGIDSPHLVRVLDVGCEYGTNYYVMEYVPGESAGALLKGRRAAGQRGLSEGEALRVVRAAAKGLAAAHAAGVVHRDIKPDNILIPKGDLDAAKLADLGLAKPEGGGHSFGTRTNVAMGTPGYMAPEQAEDAKTAGAAADVFSMGATLHGLLSGEAPFRGSSLVAILRATLAGDAAPLPPGTGAGVQWLVARCLRPKPQERFRDGSALLEALERTMREPRKAAPAPSGVEVSQSAAPPARGSDPGAGSRELMSDAPAAPRGSTWPAASIGSVAVVVLLVLAVVALMKGGGAPPKQNTTSGEATDATAKELAGTLESASRLEAELRDEEAIEALTRAIALSPDDAALKARRETLREKVRSAKTATRRKEDYERFLSAAVAVRTEADARDTEEAWGKALAALEHVRENASAPAELQDVSAREAEARARGRWAAAKALEAGGDLPAAVARAKEARDAAALPGLDDWIARVEALTLSAAERAARESQRKELEAKATEAKGEDALALLEEALKVADDPSDRRRISEAIAKLRDTLADLRKKRDYGVRLSEASERMEKGDLEGAQGSLEQAAEIWPDGPGLAEARERVAVATREKAWKDAVASAEAAEKRGDVEEAAAAWARAAKENPEDARAAAKVAELREKTFAIHPVEKGGRLEFALDAALGVRMEFVILKPGAFTHGEGKEERRFTLTKPFALQTTEVTQEQWGVLMKQDNSAFAGARRPVEQMDWYMVQEFLWELNRRLDGWTAALPSEVQWEYACRAGSKTKFMHASSEPGIEDYAWYAANASNMTHEAGRRKPNPWGLHDLSGNVAELCHDFLAEFPDRKELTDYVGPSAGDLLCVRGGGFNGDATWLPCSLRGKMEPAQRFSHVGFRAALFEGEFPAPHSIRRTFFLDAAKKVRMDFVLVRSGSYLVGQAGGEDDEPPHRVTLTRDCFIQTTETTQAQWEALMGVREFEHEGADRPAERVTWDEAQQFMKKLAQRTGMRASLPTEAEWEVACRAGAPTRWYTGSDAAKVSTIAWVGRTETSPVARLRPNTLGLYDTCGNVWEWCSDWYGPGAAEAQTDPTGPKDGTQRVIRGGGYGDNAEACGSPSRKGHGPAQAQGNVGFRAALR